jgi:hypothetical protein
MSQSRDEGGRYSSAASISSSQDAAPRGPGASIADLPSATRPGTGGMSPAASIAHDDHWSGAADQTSALLGHSGGAGRGGGMGGTPRESVAPRDYSAAYRSLALGSGESTGQTQVQAPGGRAGHGADIPDSGIPGPAGPAPAGGAPTGGVPGAGGADVAGAGLADLAPLAALA